MSEFLGGSAGVFEFIHAGGTMLLNDQHQRIAFQTFTEPIDTTSGTISWRQYAAGLSRWLCTYSGYNNGTASPLGTADLKALKAAFGTVRYSPFGTITGSNRLYGAALVTNVEQTYPYDDLAAVRVEWQGSGILFEDVW